MRRVSIYAEDIGLRYRVPRRLGFRRSSEAPQDPRTPGGRISSDGRTLFVQALDGVSFSLESGDRLGLVGPNGAGKTTLLRVLHGILEPNEGALTVEGRIDGLYNLNLGGRPNATGRRNIVLRGLIRGWTEEQIAERIDEIIEFSELGDYIDMPMNLYSAGMAARLSFATATTLNPEILLMDEWIGAGDPAFQQKARERMEKITSQAGIIVIASHNFNLLRRTCTKVLELAHGETVYFGDAEPYFEQESRQGRAPEAWIRPKPSVPTSPASNGPAPPASTPRKSAPPTKWRPRAPKLAGQPTVRPPKGTAASAVLIAATGLALLISHWAAPDRPVAPLTSDAKAVDTATQTAESESTPATER